MELRQRPELEELARLVRLRETPVVIPGVFDVILVYEGCEAYEAALAQAAWYIDNAASTKLVLGSFPWST